MPHTGHGWPYLPWTAISGRNAVTWSGNWSPTSARRRSIHAVRQRLAAACRPAISSSVSATVVRNGDIRAACRISSEYALPTPSINVGSVNARLIVCRSLRSTAANSAVEALNRSRPPRSCSARPAAPRTRYSEARFLGLASVNITVPCSKSNAASPILPGTLVPAGFQRSRPAIIRWITAYRSSSKPITSRLPSRDTPVIVLPTISRTGGSTERSRNGLASRSAFSGRPTVYAARRST